MNYLASNETSSSFQTICQHKMILQQKSADLYQEFQPIPTSLHLLVKNLEKDEKDLVEITKSHSDNISLINPTGLLTCNKLVVFINGLFLGATPLRSAVYKSVKVSSPLPLAAECLEESLIEEDIDEDLEEETLEDLTKVVLPVSALDTNLIILKENVNKETDEDEEEVLIPDKPGVSFFASVSFFIYFYFISFNFLLFFRLNNKLNEIQQQPKNHLQKVKIIKISDKFSSCLKILFIFLLNCN